MPAANAEKRWSIRAIEFTDIKFFGVHTAVAASTVTESAQREPGGNLRDLACFLLHVGIWACILCAKSRGHALGAPVHVSQPSVWQALDLFLPPVESFLWLAVCGLRRP